MISAVTQDRVVVAMSGGVDSSVAAARLVERGYDVVGVTLHLWDYPDDGSVQSRCCAPEDLYDARRVADHLGILHYTFDRRTQFRRQVVDPFVDGYLEGSTPSPCVSCNRGVKIPELFTIAEDLDARFVATGHYARIDRTQAPAQLLRGVDQRKDQSYFLHTLGPSVLERLLLPLGEARKEQVRAEAVQLGLPGADKGESQELCFVPTGRYDRFVAEQAPARVRPGPIVGPGGQVLGQHGGIHGFTRGQRRKLGVAVGSRAYVVGLSAERAEVQLGPPEALLARGATLGELKLAPDAVAPFGCQVAVRYQGQLHDARLLATQPPQLVFDQPVRAVVPGQYAVFYQGERVVGGGRIQQTLAGPSNSLPAPEPRDSSAPEASA